MIAGIVNNVLGIINKVMVWFTPAEKEKRLRIKLEELRRERKNLLNNKPNLKALKKMAKLNKEIREIEIYLMSRVSK